MSCQSIMNCSEIKTKDILCEIILSQFKPIKNGAKILAAKLGISHHSVNNWFYKRCAPDSEQLIALMVENDEIADRIIKLIEDRKQQRQFDAMDKTKI